MANEIKTNPNAPHRAIIWVEAIVYDVIPSTGECSGMEAYKIQKFPLQIDGCDRAMTIRKLNEWVEKIREESNK